MAGTVVSAQAIIKYFFVENIGVEPMTSSMPWKRSSQLS